MIKSTTTLISRIKLIILIYLFSYSITPVCFGQNQQNWLKVGEKSTNFYEIKNTFMQNNATKLANFIGTKADTLLNEIGEESEENRDLIKFQRWAEWYEPRIFESKGDLSIITQKEYEARSKSAKGKRINTTAFNASWTLLGPVNQTNTMSGNGRVNNSVLTPLILIFYMLARPLPNYSNQLMAELHGHQSLTEFWLRV